MTSPAYVKGKLGFDPNELVDEIWSENEVKTPPTKKSKYQVSPSPTYSRSSSSSNNGTPLKLGRGYENVLNSVKGKNLQKTQIQSTDNCETIKKLSLK